MMNYIVVDMEWNQPFSKEKIARKNGVKLVGEIIQIGAVKLDNEKNIIDEFEIKIAPQKYKKLHYMVKKVTGLTQSDLNSGVSFDRAVSLFCSWCGDDFLFLTWGPNDIPMLRDNLKFFSLDLQWLPECYNVQCFFNQQTDNKGRQYSVDYAVDYFGIELDRERHDALNDAYYTAKIVQRLDIRQGIRGYDGHLLYMDNVETENWDRGRRVRFSGYKLHSDIDKRIIKTKCPFCDNMLEVTRPVSHGRSKYVSMGVCAVHKDFYIEFRVEPSGDDKYCVVKSVRKMSSSEKNRVYIQNKKKRNRRHSTRVGRKCMPAESDKLSQKS